MTDPLLCPRELTVLTPCQVCGALPAEECPMADLSPELSQGAPITAGAACEVEDDGVCESCQ